MISLSIESMFGPNVETSAGSHPRIIEFTPVQRHTKVRVALLQSRHTPEHERKSSAGIGSMSGRSRLSSMIRRGLRRRLLALLGAIRAACVEDALSALAAWRALGLVAASAGHGVAGRQHLDKFAHRRRELAATLVDDRQRTQKAPFLELEHPQSAARDLVLDRHPRHD